MTTIIDVAKAACVSFKTVSRVLNGEPGVRPKTKEKVLKAAKDLDYRVNVSARSLRSKRRHLVALLINNPSRSYSDDLQFGAVIGCQNAGFSLLVENPFDDESLIRLVNQPGLLGAILAPPFSDNVEIINKLIAANVAFVRVGTELEIKGSSRIGIDDRQAAFDITKHLIDLGHTSIALINGPSIHHICQRRKEGYFDAIEAANIQVDRKIVTAGDFTYVSGVEHTEVMLNSSRRPTAIFAANDEMAAGCLAAAYKLNIRVPDQLSVVGFDDSPVGRVVS
ncbi:MAG: LacI family transcriptional regulator, partial [Acidimicrobiales bacterium]